MDTALNELSRTGAAYATGDVCSSCLQTMGADPSWAGWAAALVAGAVRLGIYFFERHERRTALAASNGQSGNQT